MKLTFKETPLTETEIDLLIITVKADIPTASAALMLLMALRAEQTPTPTQLVGMPYGDLREAVDELHASIERVEAKYGCYCGCCKNSPQAPSATERAIYAARDRFHYGQSVN